MAVRYYSGLLLDNVTCPHCQSRGVGTVYQQRIRWICKLKCGHTKTMGYVQPPDELKRKGLTTKREKNPENERARKQREIDVALEREEKMAYWERLQNSTNQKYF